MAPVWEVKEAESGTRLLHELLAEGFEPFAATTGTRYVGQEFTRIWLRRLKSVS